ncbi:MAG TPA: leucine-rich repeat domain-containing protein, partial [Flavitalea sp.]|nr:leucine-rich repeat domain-containing protein [Flavitalea sp.]
MILRILFILLYTAVSISASAQRWTDKNVKVTTWLYPRIATTQSTSYQVIIHNGSIPLESAALIKKKGLMARVQRMEDDINNRTPDYFTYYPYTVASSNPALLIEISFGNYSAGLNAMKEHTIPCKVKGAKLTKETLHECPAYYYERNYSLPYVIRISDKSGNVLLTELFAGKGVQTFGFDASGMSGYLKKGELETAYATQERNQPMLMASQAMAMQIEEVEPVLQSLCFYSPVTRKLSIASAAGKNFDYTALDAAQKVAINAFENIKKTSATTLLTSLEPAITTWKKELATFDMKQDNARINRSIATGLYANLALAYSYGWKLDSASVYAQKAQSLVKFSISENAKEDIAQLVSDIQLRRDQLKAYQAQAAVTAEPTKAPMLLDALRVKTKDLTYAGISGKSKYDEWAKPLAKKEEGNILDKVIESYRGEKSGTSGANKYEARVVKNSLQGYVLNIAAFFDGKMETIPEEICSITYLNELSIASNSIKTIPESISQLTELKRLNLSNNQLTSLPKELQECKKLKMVNLKGNSIPAAEIEALQKALPECKIKV